MRFGFEDMLGCRIPRVRVQRPDRDGWNAIAVWGYEVSAAHARTWDMACLKALARVVPYHLWVKASRERP